jgi:hypothetical protein
VLPPSLFIGRKIEYEHENEERDRNHGGSAHVYRAKYQGRDVAVKHAFRDTPGMLKVRHWCFVDFGVITSKYS